MGEYLNRFSAIKKKQESYLGISQPPNRKGTEELVSERDAFIAELAKMEHIAKDAQGAIFQISAFLIEHSADLGPRIDAEIQILEGEAAETLRRFEKLKMELAALNKIIREESPSKRTLV